MHATLPLLRETDFPPIRRNKLETLQVNLGYRCNQQCLHCHVNAGPKRKENMDEETVNQVIDYLKSSDVKTLDLTGGAPELNPHFRYLVTEARKLNIKVIDRCNLTILSEPGQDGLAEFLAENNVEVVASLPCYLEDNVDTQRGKGVFDTSLKGLAELNSLGYGKEHSDLTLNLVYNPQGPTLPPSQVELQASYKEILKEKFDVDFNQLFTITNMPIKRFGSMLISKGQFADYMQLLRDNYSASNLDGVMCLNTISVDYNGDLFDCDFNQMLELPLKGKNQRAMHISTLAQENINDKSIVIADHCYGCTAGQGSSCGGALGD
ncbi:MAG: arsenosugar biosynthesis radical SAM protein ArsS [Gammaproteobacteria bacterium]|nr:arsenosugar biosynthesis radical SAM protein ArsS [Gammaproteobacteria bacterium]